MYYFKNIMVALDGSELDEDIIKFASYFARSSKVEHLFFVNIIKNLSIPPQIAKEFPGMLKNALDERKQEIKEKVEKYLDNPSIECRYLIEEGNPSKKILDLTSKYNIDFVIIGRKARLAGSGVITNRLARRATCSLLIIPDNANLEPKKILVPIDFSSYSRDALIEATAIASRSLVPMEIVCQNVYHVPVGYHYTGKTYEEFGEIMRQNAMADYDKFIGKMDLKNQQISVKYTLDKDEEPVADIYQSAIDEKADLIIIGAKGRTASTALFIGSMAERLIHMNDTIPMMVIRPKGKAAGWLDLLKDI